MSFTEIIFVPFLLIVLCAFAFARHRPQLQLVVLLIASFVFYSWWRADCVILLLMPALIDYATGKLIYRSDSTKIRRFWLGLSLVSNLLFLGYFKYFNWMLNDFNWLLSNFDVLPFDNPPIVLPVGISFYTFMTMSYTIDIYRREIEPCHSLLRYLVFISFFPHLVAGPILRAKDLLPQLQGNLAARSDPSGLWLMLYGFVKKLFIADFLGAQVVNPTFADMAACSKAELILATYGFAFQIFLDFSSYSDIAIGLGRLFGVSLPVNFRSPYSSTNAQEFWRRWHISLSTWFRDYLYIPLGGARGSQWLQFRNLTLTMLLAGLWHGANATFLVWGSLHALYLCVFHAFHRELQQGKFVWWHSIPQWLRAFLFFQLLCLAWVFFRLPSLEACLEYFLAVASHDWLTSFRPLKWTGLFAGALFFTFVLEARLDRIVATLSRLPPICCAAAYQLLFISIYWTDASRIGHQVFIYFQF